MIKIVNIKTDPYDVYCGRGSALGNPFLLTKESDRNKVIDQYKEYFYKEVLVNKNTNMISQLNIIKELSDKGIVRLGCFCKPKRCHCDVIKNYLDCVEKEDYFNSFLLIIINFILSLLCYNYIN